MVLRPRNMGGRVARVARTVVRAAVREAPRQLLRRIQKKYLTPKDKAPKRPKRPRAQRTAAVVSDIPDQMHSGVGHSSMSVRLNPPVRKKTAGKWVYTQQNQSFLTSDAGTQNTTVVLSGNAYSQMMTSTATPTVHQTAINMFDMNPYAKPSGSGVIPSTTAVQDKLIILKNNFVMDLSNMSNEAVFLEFYVITPKSNHSQLVTDCWEQGLVDASFGATAQAFNTHAIPAGAAIGRTNIAMVGQHPTASPLFRKTWKILKVKKLSLAAAAIERFSFNVTTNKLIDKSFLTRTAESYLKGTTVQILVLQHGQVIQDTVAVKATYSSSKVGFVLTHKLTCCAIKDQASRQNFNESYSSIPILASLAEQSLMTNDDDVDMGRQA